MRMKFNKSSQLLLVSAASLLVAGLITACGTLTVDFVFVTSSKAAGPNNYGEIDVFEINSESGFMRQIPTSPFPSGGRNPVAEAVSSDNTNLYVVNQDDNTIVQFVIGNDGKLYPQNTVNTPGIFPWPSPSADRTCSSWTPTSRCPPAPPRTPCSGSIAVFPIAVGTGKPPSDTAGTPYQRQPDLLAVDPARQSQRRDCAHGDQRPGLGRLRLRDRLRRHERPTPATSLASAASTGGSLPLYGGWVPSRLGNLPRPSPAIPAASYVYVTDSATAQSLASWLVASGSLSLMAGSPFPAGNEPSAIVVDPSYPFAYVANSLDSTVTAYSIGSGGTLSSSSGTYPTGRSRWLSGSIPPRSHFVFTANYLGGTISGFQFSATAGTLILTQNSPYTANALPTAVAAIPHGSQQK